MCDTDANDATIVPQDGDACSAAPSEAPDERSDVFFELGPRVDASTIDHLASMPIDDHALDGTPTIQGYAARVRAEGRRVDGVYFGMREAYSFDSSTKGNYGRLISSQGAQALPGEVQRHLFHCNYEHLIIKNAQPAMLYQAMSEYTGPKRAIEQYVQHRELCSESLCTSVSAANKSAAKLSTSDADELYFSVLSGKSVRRWTELHGPLSTAPEHCSIMQHVEAYFDEVKMFVGWFEGQHGAEVALHDAEPPEQRRMPMHYRHISLYLQNQESIVMREVVNWVYDEHGGEVGVLIHDGCLVRSLSGCHLTPRCLDSLSAFVLRETGHKLEFQVKSLEPTMSIDQLVGNLCGEQQWVSVHPKENSKDNLNLDQFVKFYRDKLKFGLDGSIYHYADDKTYARLPLRGTWVKGTPPGAWWERLFPGMNISKMSQMRKELLVHYPQLREALVWETYEQHCVPLADKMLNLVTGETRDFTPELMLTRKLPITYKQGMLDQGGSADEEVRQMNEDNARLYDDNTQLIWAVEERIAYAVLVRGNPHKKLINFVGAGNNGKSSVWSRARTCAGEEHVTMLSAKQLAGRQSAIAPNPQLRAALGANLVVVEEPSKEEPLSAALLKELSGNTVQKERSLYEKGSRCIVNNATFFFMSNHPFQARNADQAYVNRLERIGMPCTFFQTAELRDEHLQGFEDTDERSVAAQRCHLADPNFNKRYDEPKMREVYLAALFQHYRRYVQRGALTEIPTEYAYDMGDEEVMQLDGAMQQHYENLFEETGDHGDFLTTKDIVDVFKRAKFDTNVVVVGKFVAQRVAKLAHSTCRVVRNRNKQQRGFGGLRVKAHV